MTAGITPRPVAFVSTLSPSNVGNLAPFSYFGVITHDPPLISLGICTQKDASGKVVDKDTAVNVVATKQFTVSMVSDYVVDSASYCAGAFPADVDEFDVSKLTRAVSTVVKPPYVKESSFAMECELVSSSAINNDAGVHTTTHIIGRIVKFHVIEDLVERSDTGSVKLMNDGKVLGRLGGNDWVRMGETISIARPKI
jgi:flavin reductase (DIM6/NTAB) family NADH-FMN oxidoreductase RutF